MSENGNRPVEILLVEDNPTDVMMLRAALKQSQVQNNLSVAGDGVEAIAFLRRQGVYADAPRPDLILLDLNMPKKDGREVLAEIKTDPDLMLIPVIVLTTSGSEEDILGSYALHANSYVVKPISFARFVEMIQTLGKFWFQTVTPPPKKQT